MSTVSFTSVFFLILTCVHFYILFFNTHMRRHENNIPIYSFLEIAFVAGTLLVYLLPSSPYRPSSPSGPAYLHIRYLLHQAILVDLLHLVQVNLLEADLQIVKIILTTFILLKAGPVLLLKRFHALTHLFKVSCHMQNMLHYFSAVQKLVM